MTELKPCPFCGDEAYYSHNEDWVWTVKCSRCGAEISRTQFRYSVDENTLKEDRDAVIRCWNQRVGDAE